MAGTLYLISTPLGNPDDLSLRALRVLRDVGFIAAEDTAVTTQLLAHFGISTVLTTYHGENKEEKAPLIVTRLSKGDSVALVVDAGTPGIADPGAYLVSHALRAGITIVPVPGPSAVLAALPLAEFPCDEFVFLGMLPSRHRRRDRLLDELRAQCRTAVLFIESGSLRAALRKLAPVLGNRRILLAMDMTLPTETYARGTAQELLVHAETTARADTLITVIVEGTGTDGNTEKGGKKVRPARTCGS